MHRAIHNALAFLAAAVAGATGVVACDRTVQGAGTPPARTAAAPGDRDVTVQPPAAQAGQPQPEPLPVPSRGLPAAEALSDTAITGRIQSAILADPGMEGADVSVNTDRGVVVLAGTVKTQEQAGLASAHAQRQDGVMRVDNQLSTEYTG